MHGAASLLGMPPNHLITPQHVPCNYPLPYREEKLRHGGASCLSGSPRQEVAEEGFESMWLGHRARLTGSSFVHTGASAEMEKLKEHGFRCGQVVGRGF